MSLLKLTITTSVVLLSIVSAAGCANDDGEEKLDCSYEKRCVLLKTGYASCFDEFTNPNPCCGPKVQAAILYACKQGSTTCLTFMNYCLPSGWISTDRPDAAPSKDATPRADTTAGGD